MDYSNFERPKFYPEEIANFFNCYVGITRGKKLSDWYFPENFKMVSDRENYTYPNYTSQNLYLNEVTLPRVKFLRNKSLTCPFNSEALVEKTLWVTPTHKDVEIPTFNIGDEVDFCYDQNRGTLTKGRIVAKKENCYLVESLEDTILTYAGEREWINYAGITADRKTLPEYPTEYIGALTPTKRNPQEIADFFECCVYVCSKKNNTKGHYVWRDYYEAEPCRVDELAIAGENLKEYKYGTDYCYLMRDPYSFCEENKKHNFPIIDHEDDGIVYWSHENKKKNQYNYNTENIYELKPAYVDFSEVEGVDGGLLYLPKHLRQDNTYKTVMKKNLNQIKNYEE